MPKRHGVRGSQGSLVARIEEVVLASSGADAFELVFSLVAARLAGGRGKRSRLARGLRDAAKRWPGLDLAPASAALQVPDATLEAVSALLDRASIDGDAETLDAVFEQLVTRVGKGAKGQFFTPRHVVDWMVGAMALRRGETVVDPACGSGAFLVHARAAANVEAWGVDLDARAVRVARLLAVASGAEPARIVRGDSLRREGDLPEADVIVTNPPFAGDVAYPGYEVARAGRRVERDALFVERCIELLRPGGRLGIVLPHNKVASSAFADLRRWLVEHAHVHAVVSLPRETFLPHTSQKAVVVFATKRARATPIARLDPRETTTLAASARAGKDAAGEAVYRTGHAAPRDAGWRAIDHDLADLPRPFAPARKGGAHVTCTLAELGEGIALAPERHLATKLVAAGGVTLATLVVERSERAVGRDLEGAIVLDTTHAKDGLLDVRAASRAASPPASAKKRVRPGDLLVSRLRPYLRQIALVHRATCEGDRPLACSTEFYVLSPREDGASLAFLLPWLLGAKAQAILAAAQEGGHHPRVPRELLLSMRVETSRVRDRARVSKEVERALGRVIDAARRLSCLIEE
jgi:type I restriction enzyme M protein